MTETVIRFGISLSVTDMLLCAEVPVTSCTELSHKAVLCTGGFFGYSPFLRGFVTESSSYLSESFSAYRAFLNMRDYVTVPGVVRADKVLVQSENMRKVYIEKLMEFAGEAGIEVDRAVWEAKIQVHDKQEVTGSQLAEEVVHDAGRKENTLVESDVKKNCKKRIVYGNNACFLIEYREQAINKIKYGMK